MQGAAAQLAETERVTDPTADPAVIAGASSCGPDVLVLDLEDGVADRDKPAARRHTARWLRDGNTAWVRISDTTTDHWAEDLRMLADTGSVGGVMLAKTEHPDQVPLATDGDPSTFWTTETYSSFMKPGVGIVLDAGKEVEIEHLQIVSDEPGFTAEILAGNNPGTGFVPYSQEQEIGERTTLELAGGKSYRYYVIWITDPNGRAHVNEVKAG